MAIRHYLVAMVALTGLFISCTFAIAQSNAGTRGLERAQSSEVFDKRENYAVIVGVDSYDLATPLNFAVADAKRLAAFFETQGYVVELLLNDSATPSRILRRLKTVGDVATNGGTQQQGNLVFAFSGHGFREKGENYLATGETDPDNITSTALALSDVQKTLQDTGVRQRVLFIDACRNDPAKGRSFQNGTFEPDTNAEGEAILYSTRSGTLSWEDTGLGHGVFTHYLVKGLEGAATGDDGLVSFNDLQRYVVGEVKRHVLQQFNKSQIPYIGGERTGEFVVAKYARQVLPPTDIDYAKLEQNLGLSRDERRRVQQALNASGHNVGTPDGIFGNQTRTGIRNWRESNELPGAEYLDGSSYKLLVASLPIQPQTRSFEPEMVRIAGGVFDMGSTSGESDEQPVHAVHVKDFDMGRSEVTLSQWRVFVQDSGYKTEAEKEGGCYVYEGGEWKLDASATWRRAGYEQEDSHPVVCVSWNDAQAYIKWLNANTQGGYRLPSEAEWEYAVRAGSQGKYHFGDSESQLCSYANYADKNSGLDWADESCTDGHKRTAPVGSYSANSNGLYDMYGNVTEWTEDCWHENYDRAPSNGEVWGAEDGGDCGVRVLRGGSWGDIPYNLRSADRDWNGRSNRNGFVGFRLSRTLGP